MSDFKGTVEHFQIQKFKKIDGFESKLDKLVQKAEKAKGGKNDFEAKSVQNGMEFNALGKKQPPIASIEYNKIGNIKKSPANNVVGFTYPGPDKKTPLTLNAMKFKDKHEYDYFVERMGGSSRSRSPEASNSQVGSENHEVESNRSSKPRSHDKHHRKHDYGHSPQSQSPRSKKHHSRQISPTSSSMSSGTRQNSRNRQYGVLSYVSTENIFPDQRSYSHDSLSDFSSPSPLEISYIATTSRIRDSPSSRGKSRGRGNEVKVTRVYRATRSMSISASRTVWAP